MIYYHLNRIHIQISLQDLILQSIYSLLGASIYLSSFILFHFHTHENQIPYILYDEIINC
jgi:hypothetical protein